MIVRTVKTSAAQFTLRSERGIRGMMKLILMMTLLLTLRAPLYAGRGDKSGTAGAAELLIPVGARSIALGGASLASVSGAEALYWNPAGLARSEFPTSVMFSHTNYLSGIGIDYFAIAGSFGGAFNLGLSVKSLSFGQIHVTTEDQPDGTGEITSPNYYVIGGTFARQITDRISVGLTSNFVYEQMAKVTATTVAFNGGIQYIGLGGIDGLGVGVAVKNIGPPITYDGEGLDRRVEVNDALTGNSLLRLQAAPADLPSTIEIGLGYSALLSETGKMRFESTFQNNNFSNDEYKLGMEYIYDQKFSLRAGYAFSSSDEGSEYIYGFSGGVGVQTSINNINIGVSYAYRAVKYFSGNHIIDILLFFQ